MHKQQWTTKQNKHPDKASVYSTTERKSQNKLLSKLWEHIRDDATISFLIIFKTKPL